MRRRRRSARAGAGCSALLRHALPRAALPRTLTFPLPAFPTNSTGPLPSSAFRTIFSTEGHSFKASWLWAEIVQKHTPVETSLVWTGDAAAPEPLEVVGDTSPQAEAAPEVAAAHTAPSRQGRRLAALATPTPYTGDTVKSSAIVNSFPVEPPDQAVCAGAGYVMAGTNNQAGGGCGAGGSGVMLDYGQAGWRTFQTRPATPSATRPCAPTHTIGRPPTHPPTHPNLTQWSVRNQSAPATPLAGWPKSTNAFYGCAWRGLAGGWGWGWGGGRSGKGGRGCLERPGSRAPGVPDCRIATSGQRPPPMAAHHLHLTICTQPRRQSIVPTPWGTRAAPTSPAAGSTWCTTRSATFRGLPLASPIRPTPRARTRFTTWTPASSAWCRGALRPTRALVRRVGGGAAGRQPWP